MENDILKILFCLDGGNYFQEKAILSLGEKN